jgi:hypothetical protein
MVKEKKLGSRVDLLDRTVSQRNLENLIIGKSFLGNNRLFIWDADGNPIHLDPKTYRFFQELAGKYTAKKTSGYWIDQPKEFQRKIIVDGREKLIKYKNDKLTRIDIASSKKEREYFLGRRSFMNILYGKLMIGYEHGLAEIVDFKHNLHEPFGVSIDIINDIKSIMPIKNLKHNWFFIQQRIGDAAIYSLELSVKSNSVKAHKLRWGEQPWANFTFHDVFAYQYAKGVMYITPLGVGNLMSVNNNSSFVIEADKQYLVDMPPKINAILGKARMKHEQLNDVILTHVHPDHAGGLEEFLLAKNDEENKINLYTTKEIYKQLIEKQPSPYIRRLIESRIALQPLEFDKPYANNGVEIEIRENIHGEGIQTIGFKFSHKGKTLGYSGDCYFNSKILRERYEKELRDLDNILTIKINEIEEKVKIAEGHYRDLRNSKDYLPSSEGEPLFQIGDKEFLNIPNPDELYKVVKSEVRKLKVICGSKKKSIQMFYDKANVRWFLGCNMIIHEATSKENDGAHTFIGELENLPLNRIENMHLIHVTDDLHWRKNLKIPILHEYVRYRL